MRCSWRAGLHLCALLLALAIARPATAGTIDLPAGPGRTLVYGTCQTCHDLQYLKESAGIGREDWSAILDAMHEYGLRIPQERQAKILDYLATYLGDQPPPAAPTAAAQAAATAAAPVDGAKLFATQCTACHQATGRGVPGAFPPLAGNPDLFHDRTLPVHVVLSGMQGRIQVEGRAYNGQMPSFAHLSDAEIAAVINHIRGAWNNAKLLPPEMKPVDAELVKRLRATPLTPRAVHSYRESHK